MKFTSFVVLLFIFSIKLEGQSRQVLEAKLILKFIENVEWPSEKSSRHIGVLGNSRILTEIHNKIKENQLTHTVKRINYLEEASNFDMVIVPGGRGLDVQTLLKQVEGQPILLIAEEKKIANMNIDICFFEEEKKLRFVINETNAKTKGLKFSDNLLDYAAEIN